jgi:hypothetical protein
MNKGHSAFAHGLMPDTDTDKLIESMHELTMAIRNQTDAIQMLVNAQADVLDILLANDDDESVIPKSLNG